MKLLLVITACCVLLCSAVDGQTAMSPGKYNTIVEGECTAQINGLRLWYKIAGTGPVCILPTPGWGPSSDLYFLKLKPLESMFTMVYLDTRGSGRSERPEAHSYTMRGFVADIEGLREHLGAKTVWLMGHSDGARMVLNYAVGHAEHVQGLILVDAPAGNSPDGSDRIERMKLRKNEPWFDTAFAAFQKEPANQKEFDAQIASITPFFFSSSANLEKNRDVFRQTTLSFDARHGEGLSDRSESDLAGLLPGMKIPVLIIVGADDFVCPPTASEYLHGLIANSKLLVIEKAGHFPWLEQPRQFFAGMQAFLPRLGYQAK